MNGQPVKPAEMKAPHGKDRWFCIHCGDSYLSENGLRIHVKNTHLDEGEEAEHGVDYAQGWQMILLTERYEMWLAEWERSEGRISEGFFASLVGVDDFLLECENDR